VDQDLKETLKDKKSNEVKDSMQQKPKSIVESLLYATAHQVWFDLERDTLFV
jgi:hypothetical protein